MDFKAYTLSSHPEWACVQLKTPESESRTPVHLCCIIDTSGSMEFGNKLNNVKQSLSFLLDFLGPQDMLSIITFSTVARNLLTQIYVTDAEKENIRTRISIILPELNTNLSAGLIEARTSLLTNTQAIKQGILLLTDGVANMGIVEPDSIKGIVQSIADGTSISCVGYGTDHNVDLLQTISSHGGGSYYVVNNLEDVAVVFGDILGSLMSCTAQQVRVTIHDKNADVKTRYAVDIQPDNATHVIVGDMAAGMEATFLAKVSTNTQISLSGYNIQTHSPFTQTATVSATTDNTLQLNGEAHYLRFEVLALLDSTRALLAQNNASAIMGQLAALNACIATVNAHKVRNAHALWDILLTELNGCVYSLENRENRHDISQVMSQHGAYIGMMRGVYSNSPHLPQAADTGGTMNTPTSVTRAFSNTTQQRISSQLHTSLTPTAARTVAIGEPNQTPVRRNIAPTRKSSEYSADPNSPQ